MHGAYAVCEYRIILFVDAEIGPKTVYPVSWIWFKFKER